MSGETLIEGINHPHSVQKVGADIAVCESNERAVRVGASVFEIENGYTRGLLVGPDYSIVGTSVRRVLSRSIGRPTGEEAEGTCGVTLLTGEAFVERRFYSLMERHPKRKASSHASCPTGQSHPSVFRETDRPYMSQLLERGEETSPSERGRAQS